MSINSLHGRAEWVRKWPVVGQKTRPVFASLSSPPSTPKPGAKQPFWTKLFCNTIRNSLYSRLNRELHWPTVSSCLSSLCLSFLSLSSFPLIVLCFPSFSSLALALSRARLPLPLVSCKPCAKLLFIPATNTPVHKSISFPFLSSSFYSALFLRANRFFIYSPSVA